MYKLITALCLIIPGLICSAQNNRNIDSLLKVLDAADSDTSRMKLYNKIGHYYADNNAGKAIDYFIKAQEIAKKLDRKLVVGNTYYDLGFAYLMKGDFDKSLENYLQSVRIYEALKDSFRLSNALMSIGNVYFQNNDQKKTNEYYDKAQYLIEATNDSNQLASLLGERGVLFDRQGKFDTALVYLFKAHALATLLKDDFFATNMLSNIALTYKHQGKTAQALEEFKSILEKYKAINPPVDNYAALYNNIAATQSQAGNYAEARVAFAKSIEYAKAGGNAYIEMENYTNLSEMYGKMKNYEQQSAYLSKYHLLKDSLFSADNKNQLTQLESDYQLEKKNTEIIKKDAEVIKQRSQRNVFIILALAAALFLTTLGFAYSRIRNKNKLLEEKNFQISEQKAALQTLNQVKDRLFSIISHDLRNPLVTLRSYLTLAGDDAITPEKKQAYRDQTMQAVAQTSDLLDNLLVWANMQIRNTDPVITPINIEDLVLDVENNVAAQASQKRLNIRVDLQAAVAAGDHHILSIALRNLLTNAIKYSDEAGNIYISSAHKDGNILIAVKDEGVGISAESLDLLEKNENDSTPGTRGEKGTGLGIFLVKALLEKINGRLLIYSKEGAGSTFTIQVPAL